MQGERRRHPDLRPAQEPRHGPRREGPCAAQKGRHERPRPRQPFPHHLEERRQDGPLRRRELPGDPKRITGIDARVIGLVGKHFPTGAHKVGAAFACLAPRLVTGEFDPTSQKAVWPSTGNYCRGGAFDSALSGCAAVAILPEGMSKERFAWLKSIGAEVIATPGNRVQRQGDLRQVLGDQEDPQGLRDLQPVRGVRQPHLALPRDRRRHRGGLRQGQGQERAPGGLCLGHRLGRAPSPPATICARSTRQVRVAASEALQCPTLLQNGFGEHRIEGIGDKHIPWVHNVRNTDMVVAIDDEDCMRLLRLFNEPAGRKHLASRA